MPRLARKIKTIWNGVDAKRYTFERWLINREPLIVVDHGPGENVTHSNYTGLE